MLAEVVEIEEHQQGGGSHDREGNGVLQRRSANPLGQLFPADEIGQEGMRREDRNQCRDQEIGGLAPRCQLLSRLATGAGGTFKQTLQGAIDELQVYGLGASPAAPEAAENGGAEEDADEEAEEKQCEENGVGGKKGVAEEGEASVDDVEEDEGLGVDTEGGE